MKMKPEDFQAHVDRFNGYCSNCDEVTVTGGVESDAYGRKCPECGHKTVYGVEQALLEGFIEPSD